MSPARPGGAEENCSQRVGDRRAWGRRGRAGGSRRSCLSHPSHLSRLFRPTSRRCELLERRLAIDRLLVVTVQGLGLLANSRSLGVRGAIQARSVIVGLPLASSIDTSASPTASSVIACPMSTFGFGRSVSAAVLTAF